MQQHRHTFASDREEDNAAFLADVLNDKLFDKLDIVLVLTGGDASNHACSQAMNVIK